jgi:RHS repeat-associated protein
VGIDLGGDAANCGDGGQEFSHIRSFSFFHERGLNGELLARHVHGPSVDNLVLSELGGVVYYYHHDHLNSTVAVTDSNGSVIEQYRYDVFGQPFFYSPDGTPRSESALDIRFLFTGREWLSSLGLYDYRHRIYSPSLGRFLQMDPLGFASGDVNLYVYCLNSAVLFVDPWGLYERGGVFQGQIVNLSTNTIRVFNADTGIVTNILPMGRTPPGDWDSVEIPAGSGNWVKIGPGKSVIDRCGEFKEGWLRWLHRIIKREEYLPRDVPKPVLSEKPGVQHQ